MDRKRTSNRFKKSGDKKPDKADKSPTDSKSPTNSPEKEEKKKSIFDGDYVKPKKRLNLDSDHRFSKNKPVPAPASTSSPSPQPTPKRLTLKERIKIPKQSGYHGSVATQPARSLSSNSRWQRGRKSFFTVDQRNERDRKIQDWPNQEDHPRRGPRKFIERELRPPSQRNIAKGNTTFRNDGVYQRQVVEKRQKDLEKQKEIEQGEKKGASPTANLSDATKKTVDQQKKASVSSSGTDTPKSPSQKGSNTPMSQGTTSTPSPPLGPPPAVPLEPRSFDFPDRTLQQSVPIPNQDVRMASAPTSPVLENQRNSDSQFRDTFIFPTKPWMEKEKQRQAQPKTRKQPPAVPKPLPQIPLADRLYGSAEEYNRQYALNNIYPRFINRSFNALRVQSFLCYDVPYPNHTYWEFDFDVENATSPWDLNVTKEMEAAQKEFNAKNYPERPENWIVLEFFRNLMLMWENVSIQAVSSLIQQALASPGMPKIDIFTDDMERLAQDVMTGHYGKLRMPDSHYIASSLCKTLLRFVKSEKMPAPMYPTFSDSVDPDETSKKTKSTLRQQVSQGPSPKDPEIDDNVFEDDQSADDTQDLEEDENEPESDIITANDLDIKLPRSIKFECPYWKKNEWVGKDKKAKYGEILDDKLDYVDMLSLHPRHYLTSDVIDASIALSNIETPNHNVYVMKLSVSVVLFKESNFESEIAGNITTIRRILPSLPSHFLIPLYLGRFGSTSVGHYIVAHLDLANKRIGVFNSMYKHGHRIDKLYPRDPYQKQLIVLLGLVRRFQEALTEVVWEDLGQEWPLNATFTMPTGFSVQTNGRDCGVFALLYIQYIIQDQEWFRLVHGKESLTQIKNGIVLEERARLFSILQDHMRDYAKGSASTSTTANRPPYV